MKTALLGLLFTLGTSFVIPSPTHKTLDSYYDVQLITYNQQVGANYEWVWSVTNPDPGNGKDGTLQDLSHWGLIATCLKQIDLVEAAYSTDNMTWHPLSALIAVDPSQKCYTLPVMKFNHGIDGGDPVYFKLVVNKAFNVGYSRAIFKSGRWTGCYVADIPGIDCTVVTPR